MSEVGLPGAGILRCGNTSSFRVHYTMDTTGAHTTLKLSHETRLLLAEQACFETVGTKLYQASKHVATMVRTTRPGRQNQKPGALPGPGCLSCLGTEVVSISGDDAGKKKRE